MRSIVAALPLWLMVCMANTTLASEQTAPAVVKFIGPETCIASVYSTHDKDQTGTRTASGIPLNDRVATLAHKSRPFRSYADVTNLRNGKTLPVLVTDRGPYVRGRCIDLSVAAAILLGCKGLCPVKVQ